LTAERLVWVRLSSHRAFEQPVERQPTVAGSTAPNPVNTNTAYIAVVIPPVKGGLTSGTYIATYQTDDAGASWRTTLVPLPRR
jgi:hypothetical protein